MEESSDVRGEEEFVGWEGWVRLGEGLGCTMEELKKSGK
jgi:hypothetical protein